MRLEPRKPLAARHRLASKPKVGFYVGFVSRSSRLRLPPESRPAGGSPQGSRRDQIACGATGEDPACLACGTVMMVAGHEVRKPSLISSLYDAKDAGGLKSLSARSEALQAAAGGFFFRRHTG
jgi:hypothetical protein